ARIELGFGSNLIAEGIDGKEVIFTSRNDDEFGAGGTFDTNGDGSNTTPAARNWAGIFAFPNSRTSIDRALIAYAGGVTGVGGGTAAFNPIQIHQAEARIANSVFRDNGDGTGGGQLNARRGYAPNDSATIYVTNAQPTIVGNTLFDNAGSVISINSNSLNAEFRSDTGRQTGDVDQFGIPPANTGPVVRGNELSDNDVNGMEIRGEVLTTEVIWDDTDIVHVLRNDIEIPDVHTYGGLRLESSSTESLVVKLDDAEILATGRSLDITDRIGGRLHVIGSPGFPVIMTSVFDDSVGASFAPDGSAQTQTIKSASPNIPGSGDWQGLKFDAYSHDRNVAIEVEREGLIGGFGDANAAFGGEQELGILAPNEKSGDENVRLGFTLHGAIAADRDQDLYSFEGIAGTMVWLDIDETDSKLDTVLEFLDGNGVVLALSQNSRTETANGALTYTNTTFMRDGHALPMELDHDAPTNHNGEYRDLFSNNDGDSAMRVVLPGTTGSQRTYFVRVRSSNQLFNLTTEAGIAASLATGGTTQGGYRLQVRLQETDDFAGSVVRYSDIRYATKAIDAIGLPVHSSIAGEVYHDGTGTVDLGSFTNTDRGAISATGNAATPNRYSFNVGRDGLQGINPTTNAQSLTFDVDWADGLTRPNTNLYLYDGTGLIAIGTDSNIADDRITPIVPGQPTTEEDLSRGSQGSRDPFIGPLELNPDLNYEVIVANDSQMAADLRQFTQAGAPNKNARLEPLDSTLRIIDDRFDIAGAAIGDLTQVPRALQNDATTVQVGFGDSARNVIGWQFGDIPLITVTRVGEGTGNSNNSQINVFNPFTGRHDAVIDENTDPVGAVAARPVALPVPGGAASNSYNAIGIERPTIVNFTDDDTNEVYALAADGTLTSLGTTGIETYEHYNNNDADPNTNTNRPAAGGVFSDRGVNFTSLGYYNHNSSQASFLYGFADRGDFSGGRAVIDNGAEVLRADLTGGNEADINADNLIYLLDAATGAGISRNAQDMAAGFESVSPLDGRINDNSNNIRSNYPNETPWAGTNVVAQLQVPESDEIGNPLGKIISLVSGVNGDSNLYAFTDLGAVWQFPINVTGAGDDYAPGDLEVDMVVDATSPTGWRIADTHIFIDPNTYIGPLPAASGDAIVDSLGNQLIFESVTKGPSNFSHIDDGIGIGSLFFGVKAGTGRLYAFDLAVSAIAEPIFEFGAEGIDLDTGLAGSGGIAGFFFSSLDTALWHASDTNAAADGHGKDALDDRGDVNGGGSLRLGFDVLDDDFSHIATGVADSNLDAEDLQGYNGYNFLGGAHGSIQSDSIDLSGVAPADLPMLYFTYVLDSEGKNANIDTDNRATFNDAELDDVMRDSLRVYVAGDNDQWTMVATNNVQGGIGGRNWDNPFDTILNEYEGNINGYTNVPTQTFVQELFDDNVFRQARIDLGPWAGQKDVQIRYEFSTAGESRPDQTELYALPGELLTDAQTFTVDGSMPDPLVSTQLTGPMARTLIFEFDLGLVAEMPAGSHVVEAGGSIALSRPDTTNVVELITT
ncbi:MAG: hypothetical protein HKN47_27455, partial [Pirellulaceae bacterium]|nr:hypothetical protein [Pirellulaceae bacterium]